MDLSGYLVNIGDWDAVRDGDDVGDEDQVGDIDDVGDDATTQIPRCLNFSLHPSRSLIKSGDSCVAKLHTSRRKSSAAPVKSH